MNLVIILFIVMIMNLVIMIILFFIMIVNLVIIIILFYCNDHKPCDYLVYRKDHEPGGRTSRSPSLCGRGPTWSPGTWLWKYFWDIFIIFSENDSLYFRIVTFSEYCCSNIFTVQVYPCFLKSLLIVISSRSRAFIVFLLLPW